jgi:hypothetical protein
MEEFCNAYGRNIMGERGRKSLEDLTITAVVPGTLEVSERQRPPHDLTDEECEVWAGIVASEPADWFSIANRPILAQFCRHVVHARRVAKLIERTLSKKKLDLEAYDKLLKMQERESRMQVTLATKMRLTNQSTSTHRGNKRTTLAKKPWE